MNLQRLKFAYARGARIECRGFHREWCVTRAPSWSMVHEYRINPDDAHLEYGPLSTALLLPIGESPLRLIVAMLCDELYMEPGESISDMTDDQAVLWDLMCAEFLCDEGS